MRMNGLMSTERFYLSDGGLETVMIFDNGFELPCFSAAELLNSSRGRQALVDYYERFAGIAQRSNRGFVMDTPTWRSGTAWSTQLGQSIDETLAVNTEAVAFISELRDRLETPDMPILVNGVIGPAGDAYAPGTSVSAVDALQIHTPQIQTLADAGVDLISAMTLTHASEASGIAQAARAAEIPVVIAFTLETDGKLPSGQPLGEAIDEVDDATDKTPVYYMINCAHPDHFRDILAAPAPWLDRIGGLRANASRMSHAELDEATELDAGDPEELGELSVALMPMLPNLRVVGGCCGTDHRHVGCIANHDVAQIAG